MNRGQELRRNPERHIRLVYGYVAYQLDEESEAESVTAQVMGYAGGSEVSMRGEPMTDWLVGLARGAVAARLAAHRPEPSDTEASNTEPSDTEPRSDLSVALARLSASERELLALRYGADLGVRRIASMLGRRASTVELALDRAAISLRRELKSLDADDGSASLAHPVAALGEP